MPEHFSSSTTISSAVFPEGIPKTLVFRVRGYPKLGDTQNTVIADELSFVIFLDK